MREKLGQHFLIDKKALEIIASGLDIKPTDTIIEIGPGHGELTFEIENQISGDCRQTGKIKNNSAKIIAIEKDKELAENLKSEIKNSGIENIEVIEGDALKEIKNQISHACRQAGKIKNTNQKSKIIKNLKIAGNIPYYITGYLFRILEELENKPSLIIFTIQKEVAERICAKPLRRRQACLPTRQSYGGQAKMNLLAASVQIWANPEILSIIGKKSFSPPPEVDSAIIKLTPKKKIKNLESYYKLIKILFKQPRKTILNNLASGLNKPKNEVEEILKKLNINPTDRPQNLSINKIEALSAEF